jgi:hypothetical protein
MMARRVVSFATMLSETPNIRESATFESQKYGLSWGMHHHSFDPTSDSSSSPDSGNAFGEPDA